MDAPISSSRYELGNQVGSGQWGRVFKATDKILRREVAIKVLDPTQLAGGQMTERRLALDDVVSKEALELMPCSYIVPRQLEKDDKGIPFFVMPFYSTFLSDVIDRDGKPQMMGQGLEASAVLNYMRTLARGVAEMHHKFHRVHGDLKPDNLAIDNDSNILVSDFGTATYAVAQHNNPRDNMGCRLVRAPECFIPGSHPSRPSDVYSFGSLIYRMITGRFPFQKERDDGTLSDIVVETYKDKDEWNTFVDKRTAVLPKPFRNLVRSCMYDDAQRIQHGQELVERVDEMIDQYERMQPRRRLKRAGMIAAGIALVAALGFVGYELKKSADAAKTELHQREQYWDYNQKLEFIKRYDAGDRYFGEYPDYFELAKINHWEERVKDRRTAFFIYLRPDIAKELIRERGTFDFDKIEPERFSEGWKEYRDVTTLGRMMDSWMFSERFNKEKKVEDEYQDLKSQMKEAPSPK